jgi:FPC/CPF motif-containing protein YcgG
MSTLQERINAYLRESVPFHTRLAQVQEEDVEVRQYFLAKAENELREAEERLSKLRQKME